MPKLSTYTTRVLSKIAGLDASNNVGLAPMGMFFADTTQTSIQNAAALANSAGGGRVIVPAGTITLTAALPAYNNVVYEGVAWGADFRAAQTTAKGGTVLVGNSGINGYEYNPSDLGVSPVSFSTFVDGMLYGAGLKNLTFNGFAYGVKLGGLYNPGAQYCTFENLYFINNTQWDFWNENGQANSLRFIISQTTGAGGIAAVGSGGAVYNAGNDLWEYPEVLINAYGTRGMVFWSRGGGGATRNQDTVIGAEIGSGATTITQAATMANTSANISVTDSTKFPVGMPVTFSASVNGFTANKIYFVLTSAANVVTVSLTTYGSAVAATGNTAVNILSKGFAHFEMAGLTSTNNVTSVNIYSTDTEGSCTCRFVFQNSQYVSIYGGYIGANTGTNEYTTFAWRSATNGILNIPRAFAIDADVLSTPNEVIGNTTSTGQIINKQQFNGGASIGTGTTLDFAGQAFLSCPGANALSLVNSTSPQVLTVANTFTSSTNYEYGRFGWNLSNQLVIGTEKGSGGGSARSIIFEYGGTSVGDIGDTAANQLTWSFPIKATQFTTGKSGAPATVEYIGDRYYSHILAGTAYTLNSNGTSYGTISHITGDLWNLGSSTAGITDNTISVQWDASANVMLGLTAPATNATNGFPYMPATAGAPSGTPTAKTGYVPFRYDSTNKKFWIYDTASSTWKGVVVA